MCVNKQQKIEMYFSVSNIFKTVVIFFGIFLCNIGNTNAQEKTCSEINLTDELTELCELTPAQIIKVQPIITDFEKKRDDTYKKYRHNQTMLNKEVQKNRWDYETSLIGILTPSQMGLLKAFDQRNPRIMTCSCRSVQKMD